MVQFLGILTLPYSTLGDVANVHVQSSLTFFKTCGGLAVQRLPINKELAMTHQKQAQIHPFSSGPKLSKSLATGVACSGATARSLCRSIQSTRVGMDFAN